MRLNNRLINVLATLTFFCAGSANAAICTWSGSASSAMSNPLNWSCAGGPVNGDSLEFPDSAFTKTVNNNLGTLSISAIVINGCGYSMSGVFGFDITSAVPITANCDVAGALNSMSFQMNLTNAGLKEIRQNTTGSLAQEVTLDLGSSLKPVRWDNRLTFKQTQSSATQIPALIISVSETTPGSTLNEIVVDGGAVYFPDANLYAGLTLVKKGRLRIANATSLGALGSAANGTVVKTGGILEKQVANIGNEFLTLDDDANAPGVRGPVLSSGVLVGGNWAGPIVLTGVVSGMLPPEAEIAIDNALALSVGGVISGTADLLITSSMAFGSFTPQAANTYGGSTTVGTNARLMIGASSERLPNTTAVIVLLGGQFWFNAQSPNVTETVAGIEGAGLLRMDNGGTPGQSRLVLDLPPGKTFIYAGAITDVSASGNNLQVDLLGSGTQIFGGNNTYTGQTNITATATLDLRGNNNSAMFLGGSANLISDALARTGAIAPLAGAVSARVRPGGAGAFGKLDTVNSGGLVFNAAVAPEFEISGIVAGTSYDQLYTEGSTVNVTGVPLLLTFNTHLNPGEVVRLIDNNTAMPITGIFASVPQGEYVPPGPGPKYQASYTGGTGNNDFTLTRIPPISNSTGAMSGTVGQVFSAPALAPSGGVTPYALSISGGPGWLSGTSGVNTFTLMGTVAGLAGTQIFTLNVTDAAGQMASFPLSITVSAGATDFDWTGSVDGNWATSSNWMPAGPPTPGSIVRFPDTALTKTVNGIPAGSFDFFQLTESYTLNGAATVTLTNGNPIRFSGATTADTNLNLNLQLSAANALVTVNAVSNAGPTLRLGDASGKLLGFGSNVNFEFSNAPAGTGSTILVPYFAATGQSGNVSYTRTSGAEHFVVLNNATNYLGTTTITGPGLQVDVRNSTPFGDAGGVTDTTLTDAFINVYNTSLVPSNSLVIDRERLTTNQAANGNATQLNSRHSLSSTVVEWRAPLVVNGANVLLRPIGGNLRFNSAISGNAAVRIGQGDTGVVVFDGANTFTSGLEINTPTEVLTSANERIPNSAIVSFNGPGVLNLAGNVETVNAINGNGVIKIGNGGVAGRLTTTGATASYFGTISDMPSGGEFRQTGGTLNFSGTSSHTLPMTLQGGTFNLNGGTLPQVRMDGGNLVNIGPATIADFLPASGTSTGGLRLDSNTLNVNGALSLASGITLTSIVDGDGPGRASATGAATLAGASLSLSPTGTPIGIGSSYDVIGAASITGTFAGKPENFVFTDGGLLWRINYSATKVTITRLLPPPPDVEVDTVSETSTVSNCTLRSALLAVSLGVTPQDSNCTPGAPGSTITFDPGVFSTPQTITLTGAEEIAIETSVIIAGPGARLLTIDALDNSRIFSIDDGLPSSYANVEIYGVNLVNGLALTPTPNGGAIASEEHLTLGGVRIADSVASYSDSPPGLANGGAIAMGVEADLTVHDSLLESNQAVTFATDSIAKGGAIYMDGGALFIGNSTLTGNFAAVTGSASGPAAPIAIGGAIYIGSNGNAEIASSTVVGNFTSAINASSSPTVFESKGGGIALIGPTFADTLVIKNSVLSNQSISTGSARRESDDIFYSGGSASADYSYIASPVPPVTLTNPVIGAPLLNPLANNGGETNTISFAFGSSLLDAGDPAASGLPPFDQRGPGFPRIFGPHVDVGAFEVQILPLPSLSINNVSVSGDIATSPSLDFLVTLSAVSATDVTFSVNTSTSDAEVTDFTAISNQTVTIPMGSTSATVSVLVAADTIVEATETILLTLSTPVGASISTGVGTGSIINDDQALIRISSASSALESANAAVTITSSNVIEGLAAVNFSAFDGNNPVLFLNAASKQDFSVTPATASISSGSVPGVITVSEDSLVEAPEQFRVILTGVTAPNGIDPMAVSIDPAANTHVHTILNNDVTNAATTAASITEGTSGGVQLTFTVTLSVAAAAPVEVLVSTANFGANPADAADYSSLTNLVVSFAPGFTSRTFSIEIVSDDIVEANETLQVLLTDPALPIATIITSAVTGTINNDDSAVITVNSPSQAEGNSGSAPLNFNIRLDHPVQGTVSVNYASSDGTATLADGDYIASSGTAIFPSTGQLSIRNVPIIGDSNFEPNETLTFTLSSLNLPSGITAVTISGIPGTGTILNDDAPGGPSTVVLSAPLPTSTPFTSGVSYPVSFTVSAAMRPSGTAVVSATRQGLPTLSPISCTPTLVNGSNANELVGNCSLSPTAPGVWVTSVAFTGSGGFSDSNVSGNAVFTTALAPLAFTQSLNPTVVGQAYSVSVTASATSGGPIPTGSVLVTQFPGGIPTTAPMTAGSATVNLFSRSPVVKGLLVKFTDSSGVYTSQEAFIEHTTNPAATGMSASLSAAQGGANQPVTVTYTLGVLAPGAVPPGLLGPAGQVRVSDGVSSANCTLTFPTGSCALSPSTLGVRQITARFLSDASYLASTSPPLTYTVQQGGGSVDLMASIGNGVRVINGAQVIYTIELRNLGDATVGAASVSNALPAGALSQSYTCIAAAGSSCGAASGTGAIAQTIDVAPSGSVAYRVVVELPVAGEAPVSNSVTVTAPVGIVDANPANNSATDADPRGILGAGFEDDIE